MNWQNFIKYLLEKELKLSPKEVENLTGIKQPVIDRWKTGVIGKPQRSTIRRLEEGLNIKIDDSDPENIRYTKVVHRPSEGMEGALPVQMIPVLATVYAGEPEYLHTEITDQEMPALNLIPGHRYYGLVVSGKSMDTTLRDGDKIVVDMDAPLEDGCLVAVKLKNGQQYVKRYHNLNFVFIQLSSDNKDYGVRLVDKNDIAACHRVVSVYFAL